MLRAGYRKTFFRSESWKNSQNG